LNYLTTFTEKDSTEDIVKTLKADGGVIIERLVPEEVMDEAYQDVQNNVSEADQSSSTSLWPEGNRTVGGLAAASPTYTEKLVIHPKTLEIVDAMLMPVEPMSDRPPATESQAEVVENEDGGTQVIFKAPVETDPNCHHYNIGAAVMLEVRGGPNSKHQVLHRENAIYQPFIEHLPDIREFLVSAMWAGSDFTRDNGATRVVPGSHRWPEDRIAQKSEIVQAEMPKGSLVMWLSRTLHGSAKSNSDQRRTGFFNSYLVDWIRQEENQFITVPPEIAENFSDQAKKVIGYSASPNLGWVKGRDKDNLLIEGTSSPL